MDLSCIRRGTSFSIFIFSGIFCNQLEYRFDERLSTKIQEDIKNSIQDCIAQKKNASYLASIVPTQYPCVQSVTIEHLPENKDQIHITSVQPHIIVLVGKNKFLIDTHGHCLSPECFKQEDLMQIPVAYATKNNIVEHWDARLAQAIVYFKVTRPDSRIEIDNAHAIRVQPNTEAVIISDAYQLPTQEQLAICDQQTEQHKSLPAGHLKKCKQLTFDTRFDKQVIQRCIFTGAPSMTGVNIGGTGHGSHTT